MDSEDEERAEEPKNVSINTTKNDTNSIHSYSIMKVKKPKTLKTKKPANFASKQITLTSQGKKFSVSVDRRKKKLYEMGKLQDPVAEKNRLNALNAKKNRDRKKQQLAASQMPSWWASRWGPPAQKLQGKTTTIIAVEYTKLGTPK